MAFAPHLTQAQGPVYGPCIGMKRSATTPEGSGLRYLHKGVHEFPAAAIQRPLCYLLQFECAMFLHRVICLNYWSSSGGTVLCQIFKRWRSFAGGTRSLGAGHEVCGSTSYLSCSLTADTMLPSKPGFCFHALLVIMDWIPSSGASQKELFLPYIAF